MNKDIKEADKGVSVAILSKSHYKSMILSQLNDEKTYKKLNSNPNLAIMKKIKALITTQSWLLLMYAAYTPIFHMNLD